jgi:hypothetical protein
MSHNVSQRGLYPRLLPPETYFFGGQGGETMTKAIEPTIVTGARTGFATTFARAIASLFAIILLCLGTLPANAQNSAFEAAEKVPASVHSAMAGGYWSRGKVEGFFRTVVVAGGVEHVSHRLYIQWLKVNAKTQSYELIRTVNVKELNLGHGYIFGVKTSFGDVNSFKIDVTAKTRGGKTRRFAITAKGDGTYSIHSR